MVGLLGEYFNGANVLDYSSNAVQKNKIGFIVQSKHSINYGFTEEELDFIINYDIKYRMGDE